MIVNPPQRKTLPKRTSLWAFEKLNNFRQRVIQRAGRLIRPDGKITLSMNTNRAVENELLHYLSVMDQVA